MAELTITVANIVPQTSSAGYVENSNYYAAAALTQGEAVYIDSSGTIALASNGAAATDAVFGITLSAAEAGQPVTIQTSGQLAFGAILTAGHPYMLGATAGSIMPIGDAVAAGTVYSSLIGVAVSTTVLQFGILNSGVEFGADVS